MSGLTCGKSKAENISMMAMVMRLPTAVVIRYRDCSTDFIEGGAERKAFDNDKLEEETFALSISGKLIVPS